MVLQWGISCVPCSCAPTPQVTFIQGNYVQNISIHMATYVVLRDVSNPLQKIPQTLGHVHLQHTRNDGIYIPHFIQGLHLGDIGTYSETSYLTKVLMSAGRMRGLSMLKIMLLKMLEAQKISSRSSLITSMMTVFQTLHTEG